MTSQIRLGKRTVTIMFLMGGLSRREKTDESEACEWRGD
jgi:hypothetical protein